MDEITNLAEQVLFTIPVGDLFFRMPYNRGLCKRIRKVANELAENPDQSFPDALGEAGYTGFRRLIYNPRVLERPPLEVVIQDTVDRIATCSPVLAIHDTSEFRFKGEAPRKGLGRLNKNDQGFLGHVCLATAADGTRQALGVLNLEVLVRSEENVSQQSDWDRYNDPDKESLRWQRGVANVRKLTAGKASVIHVMDREADDYALMCDMADKGDRFIIRENHDRLLACVPEGLPPGIRKVKEALDTAVEGLCEREVSLSPRRKSSRTQQEKRHPSRRARQARLRFSAMTVELLRPKNAPKSLPKSLRLNVVAVREIDPPEDQNPVDWWLFTREPIETAEQVLRIVDWYRARWTIEEFFKALKTGCSYEKRQLESLEGLEIALHLFLPIAVNLLNLRTTTRYASETLASEVLEEDFIEVLRATGRKNLPAMPTVRQVMLAIAALGGHLSQNKEPGWIVLIRGMETLNERVLGWRALKGLMARLSSEKSDQS